MDQLDRGGGTHEPRLVGDRRPVRRLAGGEEHEQRAQALAACGDRRGRMTGERLAVVGGELGQARFGPLQQAGEARAAGAEHGVERLGPGRGRVAFGGAVHATSPAWIAMIPPAVST